ncbi:MAG: hypothetical protein R3B45_00025 [Bdellovibrionota bacterium]
MTLVQTPKPEKVVKTTAVSSSEYEISSTTYDVPSISMLCANLG